MNSSSTADALFLADNLALDFINSRYGVGDQSHDCLTDDQSVASWLKVAGLSAEHSNERAPNGLLDTALELRECLKAVVSAAMQRHSTNLTVINRVLEAGRPVHRLEWDDETQAFQTLAHPTDSSPATLLWPVADALVKLVTGDKFEFVRQCEAHDCILLFHDLSKSHRRRWCDMATCGNRMKVAAFRARKKPQ